TGRRHRVADGRRVGHTGRQLRGRGERRDVVDRVVARRPRNRHVVLIGQRERDRFLDHRLVEGRGHQRTRVDTGRTGYGRLRGERRGEGHGREVPRRRTDHGDARHADDTGDGRVIRGRRFQGRRRCERRGERRRVVVDRARDRVARGVDERERDRRRV